MSSETGILITLADFRKAPAAPPAPKIENADLQTLRHLEGEMERFADMHEQEPDGFDLEGTALLLARKAAFLHRLKRAAQNNGAQNDGAQNNGAQNDGAQNDSAQNDSAQNDSALEAKLECAIAQLMILVDLTANGERFADRAWLPAIRSARHLGEVVAHVA